MYICLIPNYPVGRGALHLILCIEGALRLLPNIQEVRRVADKYYHNSCLSIAS